MSPFSCFGRPSSLRKPDDDEWEVDYPRRNSVDSDGDYRSGAVGVTANRPLRRNSHLFKDKHVLARPAAKDKLKKIINAKKRLGDGAGGKDDRDDRDGPDPEFVALAKIYSEVDASLDLARVARSRDSLSHLLPFIMNALLYGFREHNVVSNGSGSASGAGRYAKKSSALKLGSRTNPRELSLNGTSHLVKAECERQLEAFLHEQAMRSLHFALDCAWYLTTSLFTGPPSAYHHTMTLLLSMESVVTNYSVPGDLFKKADFQGEAPAAGGAGPFSLRGQTQLTDLTLAGASGEVPTSNEPPRSPSRGRRPAEFADDAASLPEAEASASGPPPSPSAAAGGGGEIVAMGHGVHQVNLDTTGDGERDVMITFPAIKGSDEAKLKQWLDARSERANTFHAELDFIKCLTDISNGLFGIEREFRRDVLRRELEKLNSHIPKNVFIPTDKRQHRILRIVPEAAHVFSTKERVPYLMVLEVEDLGPPVEEASSDRRHPGRDRDESKRRRGRQGSISGLGPGRMSLDVADAGALGNGSSSTKAEASQAPESLPAPNLPADKFEFLPEMTPTGSVSGINVAESTMEPSSMGAALGKRDSSFRVDDSEYADDRRPPDEELIKALGEPWAVKSERIRKDSPFGSNPNWRLISCIVKARDQLRQEMFAQRLIQEFAHIFQKSKLPLYLQPYSIISTGSEAGLIETLYDAKSIDSIKKDTPNVATLQDYFIGRFGGRGSAGYKKAVKCFVQSMAGYSVVSYLLNIKDRHNGNLMIDAEGHIIHIDFGFFLSNSPGGNTVDFERSPFKLTKEMAQVMGGPKSGAWKLFRKLSIQGYVEACRHVNKIMLIVDIAYPGNEQMPCFLQGRDFVLSNLRERFGVDLTRKERAARMARLIDTAYGNWTTKAYDQFQRLSLGIAK